MVYRTYGRTGKQVSILGFGGMCFEDAYDHKILFDNEKQVVSRLKNYWNVDPALAERVLPSQPSCRSSS
jgi:predicted aldo/keto reductase-like oxidoreductase